MATNNNNNNNNTYNGVPVPQLDFGETVSEPVAPQPPKKSKAPLFIAIVLVLLAAAAFAVTAFVWPGFLVEDKPAVTDADTDVDEEGGAQTTAPTTTTTTAPAEEVVTLSTSDLVGTWGVSVDVYKALNAYADILHMDVQANQDFDSTDNVTNVSEDPSPMIKSFNEKLCKGLTVTADMTVAADGTVKLKMSESAANALIGDVCNRLKTLASNKADFYSVMKAVLGADSDAEVDAFLAQYNVNYIVVSTALKTGMASTLVQELVKAQAQQMGWYDAAAKCYTTPAVQVTVKNGTLTVQSGHNQINTYVKLENNRLTIDLDRIPQDAIPEGGMDVYEDLMSAIVIKKK